MDEKLFGLYIIFENSTTLNELIEKPLSGSKVYKWAIKGLCNTKIIFKIGLVVPEVSLLKHTNTSGLSYLIYTYVDGVMNYAITKTRVHVPFPSERAIQINCVYLRES